MKRQDAKATVFSVIIPVYNRANLVARAVDSVVNQTFQDFEIIVVDDGSTDNVDEVVAAIDDPRIKFIRVANGGASAARNVGIDHACGQYVAFLDSDDIFLPHHLETLKRALDEMPEAAIYSPVIADRGQGRSFIKPPRGIRPGEDMATYLINERGFIQTSGLALPLERARRVRYRNDARYGDDTDFAIRLQLDGCEFHMVDEPGVVWADGAGLDRLSSTTSALQSFEWLEDLKGRIPDRAYYAYRGWHVAKKLYPPSFLTSQKLFWQGLAHGAFSRKLALIVFLQIVLPDKVYRWLANRNAKTETPYASKDISSRNDSRGGIGMHKD